MVETFRQKVWAASMNRNMYALETLLTPTLPNRSLSFEYPSDGHVFMYTPLMLASCKGYGDVAAVLIKAGADVNDKNSTNGWTALIIAADRGHKDIATLLLASGARINERNNFDRTALMYAACEGHLSVVLTLLSSNADKNIQSNSDGRSALMWAASKDRVAIVRLLLSKSADINAQCKENNTALIFASMRGHAEIVKLLLHAGANRDIKNNNQQTACELAQTTDVKQLISTFSGTAVAVAGVSKDADVADVACVATGGVGVQVPATVETGDADVATGGVGVQVPATLETGDAGDAGDSAVSWLARHLRQTCLTEHQIRNCHQVIVVQEGYITEELFARETVDVINRQVLERKGINGSGVRALLISLHSELFEHYQTQPVPARAFEISPTASTSPTSAVDANVPSVMGIMEETWLELRLRRFGLSEGHIRVCEAVLLDGRFGLLSELNFAELTPQEVTIEALANMGITARGTASAVIMLHRELRSQFEQQQQPQQEQEQQIHGTETDIFKSWDKKEDILFNTVLMVIVVVLLAVAIIR